MDVAPDVEMLAPVPLEHLESGSSVCSKEGRVAFGSRAYDRFAELDAIRGDRPVRVWLYASYDESRGGKAPAATWSGTFVRWVEADRGAHPDGMTYRPPTTGKYPEDNEGYWYLFWEVEELTRLEDPIPVASFTKHGGRKSYGHPFAPEGPMLIEPYS